LEHFFDVCWFGNRRCDGLEIPIPILDPLETGATEDDIGFQALKLIDRVVWMHDFLVFAILDFELIIESKSALSTMLGFWGFGVLGFWGFICID
jgi:hypothetical protein